MGDEGDWDDEDDDDEEEEEEEEEVEVMRGAKDDDVNEEVDEEVASVTPWLPAVPKAVAMPEEGPTLMRFADVVGRRVAVTRGDEASVDTVGDAAAAAEVEVEEEEEEGDVLR